jgi:serine/threonine-protein kinase
MKVRTDAAARPRFIALVHHIGVPAGPAVRATLELALAADPAALDSSLVEDLLRALSGTPDEASGKMVAELVKSELPGVARVAVTTLAHLWGARARPLLIGVLDKAPDGVRIASLASLRATGGFDEHVIRRLDRILARVYPSGEELRAAAALAITEGTPATRNIAIEALLRTLSVPKGGLFSKLIGGGAQEDSPLVLVAAAKALLSMRVSQAHAAIFERAQKSPEPLRSRLLEMLQK